MEAFEQSVSDDRTLIGVEREAVSDQGCGVRCHAPSVRRTADNRPGRLCLGLGLRSCCEHHADTTCCRCSEAACWPVASWVAAVRFAFGRPVEFPFVFGECLLSCFVLGAGGFDPCMTIVRGALRRAVLFTHVAAVTFCAALRTSVSRTSTATRGCPSLRSRARGLRRYARSAGLWPWAADGVGGRLGARREVGGDRVAATCVALRRRRLRHREVRRAGRGPGRAAWVDHHPCSVVGDRTAAPRARDHRRTCPPAWDLVEDDVVCRRTRAGAPGRGRVPPRERDRARCRGACLASRRLPRGRPELVKLFV